MPPDSANRFVANFRTLKDLAPSCSTHCAISAGDAILCCVFGLVVVDAGLVLVGSVEPFSVFFVGLEIGGGSANNAGKQTIPAKTTAHSQTDSTACRELLELARVLFMSIADLKTHRAGIVDSHLINGMDRISIQRVNP